MSGKNNVNPGQYKVGGRDKPDDIARERFRHRGNDKAVGAGPKPKPSKAKKKA